MLCSDGSQRSSGATSDGEPRLIRNTVHFPELYFFKTAVFSGGGLSKCDRFNYAPSLSIFL